MAGRAEGAVIALRAIPSGPPIGPVIEIRSRGLAVPGRRFSWGCARSNKTRGNCKCKDRESHMA